MSYDSELVEELNVLTKFSRHSMQQGIKIHQDAAQEVIKAAQRLFAKGLITQEDGGYLTDRGVELAEKAHELANALAIR